MTSSYYTSVVTKNYTFLNGKITVVTQLEVRYVIFGKDGHHP